MFGRPSTASAHMPRTPRPYRQFSVDAMWRLLEEDPDVATLTALERELRDHRSTEAAKTLLNEVVDALATVPSSTARPARSGRPTSQRGPQAVVEDGDRFAPGGGDGPTRRDRGGRETGILRDLIGVEAERLARWGLAPGMPADIEEAVFTAWQARLTSREDMHGRCLERLVQDRRWLADHRRGE